MMPRPEFWWSTLAIVAVLCIALAGFMVGPKCGLWSTGAALVWLVRLGNARRD